MTMAGHLLRTARPGAARSRIVRGARLALAAAVLPLLGACIGEKQEKEIGNRVASQINAQVPLVQDGPVVVYVNQLGRMLARKSARPDLEYRFYVVDTDAVNAFALPGGHIYVNRGLIERTRNVSELSGVLAHEIGHVAARHGARNLQRHLRTGSMMSIMYKLILGREPEILDQDALKLGGTLWSAANSRADEDEADRLAVEYLVASGVDPEGMLTFFGALMEEEHANPSPGAQVQWFSTHPTTQSRIDKTRGHIGQVVPDTVTAGPRALARDNSSYPEFLERLKALPRPISVIPLP